MTHDFNPHTTWSVGDARNEVVKNCILIRVDQVGQGELTLKSIAENTPDTVTVFDMYNVSIGSLRNIAYSGNENAVVGTIYVDREFSDSELHIEVSLDLKRIVKANVSST